MLTGQNNDRLGLIHRASKEDFEDWKRLELQIERKRRGGGKGGTGTSRELQWIAELLSASRNGGIATTSFDLEKTKWGARERDGGIIASILIDVEARSHDREWIVTGSHSSDGVLYDTNLVLDGALCRLTSLPTLLIDSKSHRSTLFIEISFKCALKYLNIYNFNFFLKPCRMTRLHLTAT